ncbi:type II toxin-antitoxin system YafQ family toxin [uncultured Treponema sp.]|uniref:type II toxin-antitoxin system YafQ family toxin n=1 Tax=uncultured Treponema sp. TaxID=162155 RepID=UPI002595F7BA|nr:type II toxin-antitoxin system YafQ family toxin [uncultured Treponema sp.]
MNKLPPYTLKRTSTFKAHVKLAKRRGLDLSLLEEIIDKLVNRIPLEEKNHDHELTGNYKGFRECHIQPDWLLIYLVDDDVITLTATDTGTHSDLFSKKNKKK